jgi:hypothetical protein
MPHFTPKAPVTIDQCAAGLEEKLQEAEIHNGILQ